MAWWYHRQTSSKWNIGEFTKPFAGVFKGKEATRSPQPTSLYMENINVGVRQGSILVASLFLIYINDLTKGITINAKLFTNDTSSFFVVQDTQTSANDLNEDLEIVNDWAFQWKMNLNIDPTKQAQEVIFSRKAK